MATIFANHMQWSSEILSSRTIANIKSMFAEVNIHTRAKEQQSQIWAPMLSTRSVMPQEHAV